MATRSAYTQAGEAVTQPRYRGVAWYRRKATRSFAGGALVYLLLIPGAILLVLPFLWMISTSLKVPKQVFAYPPILIPNPVRFANYVEGWTKFAPFNLYLQNSLIITFGNIAGNLFSCCLAAYGFARLRARGKEILFLLVLATMMIPMWVTLIPQYVLFSYLHWTNTFAPLMVPAWFGWPLFIFLLRQFFMTIPRDLDDAARIDGCGTFGILWRILLPLTKPALATVTVLAFIGNWNNFMTPLIYLRDPDKYTLAIGLQRFQGVQGNVQYHYMMAVAVLTVLPIIIIFFFAQKYFVQGIVMTGIKG
jgi:ABC-type glycerol-3-phosphate transport system permease component